MELQESGMLDPNTRFVFCGSDGLGRERDTKMSRWISRILGAIPNWKIIPAKPREELRSWLAGTSMSGQCHVERITTRT